MSKGARLSDLPNVGYVHLDGNDQLREVAEHATASLVKLGVRFADSDLDKAPWLVAAQPFELGPDLHDRLTRLGRAVFALLDAAQRLYTMGDPIVRAHLDTGVPPDLRGLDVDRFIDMYRLDVVVSGGQPYLTEVEEIFGNAGKAHAFDVAYGISAARLFEAFQRLGIERIWLDDEYAMYRSENELVATRMAEQFGADVRVDLFSRFRDDGRVGWRFCYVKEFRQYDEELRARILRAAEHLTNPLFHGYGTKGLLALAWDERIAGSLRDLMGAPLLDELRAGVPKSQFFPTDPDSAVIERLKADGRNKVLKVVDSDGVAFTWGSRGVYFGDQSTRRWHQAVDAAAAGHIPGHPTLRNTRYLVTDLVDSDRFDVPFLHPVTERLCLMPQARMRLTPIFGRDAAGGELLGGHATFVNTSRKVHLGRHAVCTPFTWSEA